MVSRPSNIRGREIGVSEGQTGTQSGSESREIMKLKGQSIKGKSKHKNDHSNVHESSEMAFDCSCSALPEGILAQNDIIVQLSKYGNMKT